jgi:hypothetical protein
MFGGTASAAASMRAQAVRGSSKPAPLHNPEARSSALSLLTLSFAEPLLEPRELTAEDVWPALDCDKARAAQARRPPVPRGRLTVRRRRVACTRCRRCGRRRPAGPRPRSCAPRSGA